MKRISTEPRTEYHLSVSETENGTLVELRIRNGATVWEAKRQRHDHNSRPLRVAVGDMIRVYHREREEALVAHLLG